MEGYLTTARRTITTPLTRIWQWLLMCDKKEKDEWPYIKRATREGLQHVNYTDPIMITLTSKYIKKSSTVPLLFVVFSVSIIFIMILLVGSTKINDAVLTIFFTTTWCIQLCSKFAQNFCKKTYLLDDGSFFRHGLAACTLFLVLKNFKYVYKTGTYFTKEKKSIMCNSFLWSSTSTNNHHCDPQE